MYASSAPERSGNLTLASKYQNEGPYTNQRNSKGRIRKAPKERMFSQQLIDNQVVYSEESANREEYKIQELDEVENEASVDGYL